jgi:hypothetical protein
MMVFAIWIEHPLDMPGSTLASQPSADALLERMLSNIDGMCAERDKFKKALAGPTKGKVLGGRSWHV